MFNSRLTLSSLKLPIQHDPTPITQAVMTMFCNAIEVPIIDHFLLRNLIFAHPTTVIGESLICLVKSRLGNSFLISYSVKTMKCNGFYSLLMELVSPLQESYIIHP